MRNIKSEVRSLETDSKWRMLSGAVSLALATILLLTSGAVVLAKGPSAETKEQVSKLVAVLKSDASRKEKSDACRELARIGTKDAVVPLAALLPNEELSHMARYGLETIPDKAVDQAFREALGKVQGNLLVGVIGSIGVRRDAKAVKPLTQLLRDPNPDVAQAAARALGKIGTARAAKAIQAALPEEPAGNQVAFCEGLFRCAEALAAKGDRKEATAIYDQLRTIQASHQIRTAALRGAILTRLQAGLPLLVESLGSGDYLIFAAAVRTSMEMPGSEVTRTLASAMGSASGDKQILLILALGRRGDETALPALFAVARNGNGAARLAAIRALPQIGSPSASPVLLELLGASDKDIAAAAQEGLAALPGQEVDSAVMAMLAGNDNGRRITAMDLIVRRRMVSAIPAMLGVAGDPDLAVRTAAVKKVGELGGIGEMPKLLDLLMAATGPEDLEAREQALIAISVKPTTDRRACVEQLEGRMAQAQPAQQCALLRVFGAAGGPSALKIVRTAVESSNPEVHAAAIRVLGGWSNVEAAPDLLAVAQAATNPTDKMICLRGYLGIAGQSDLPSEKRLTMCRQAAALVQKDDEKKLLLAALGSIQAPEALDQIKPYLDDTATKEEAATASVNIADKLLKGGDAAKVASKLIEPLEKVAQMTANADLAQRAKGLAERARDRSATK
jgi:HEAT repeat protein